MEFIAGTKLYMVPEFDENQTSILVKNLYTKETLQKVEIGDFPEILGVKYIESENIIAIFT